MTEPKTVAQGLGRDIGALATAVDRLAQHIYDERDRWPSFDDETRVRLDEAAGLLSWLSGRLYAHATTTAATHFSQPSKSKPRKKR